MSTRIFGYKMISETETLIGDFIWSSVKRLSQFYMWYNDYNLQRTLRILALLKMSNSERQWFYEYSCDVNNQIIIICT